MRLTDTIDPAATSEIDNEQLRQLTIELVQCKTKFYTIETDDVRMLVRTVYTLRGALRDVRAVTERVSTEALR